MSLLDQIADVTISRASGPRILSENHDLGSIAIELPNFDQMAADAQSDLDRLSGGGGWDEAEYGISRAAALRRLQEATTPEGRAKVVADLRQLALRRANLDVVDGKVAVAVAGEPAWHRLGVNVQNAMTSKEAIVLASLNKKVFKTPLSYAFTAPDGTVSTRPADGVYAIVREDGKCYGSVGGRYEPIQNEDAFAFMDGVLGDFGARYVSAGAINGGRSIFLVAEFPQQAFAVNGIDEVKPYLCLVNSHDGTSAAAAFPSTTRMVCANTVRIALQDRKKGLSIRHTGNVKNKITQAKAAMGLAVGSFGTYKEKADVMAKTPCEPIPYFQSVLDECLEVTEAQMLTGADVVARLIAKSEEDRQQKAEWLEKQFERRNEIFEQMVELYDSERNGIGGMRGTAWASYNSVTEFSNHNKVGRQVGSAEKRASRRFESILGGTADRMNQVALTKALALAN
jgi:phage/plasmid-like protein (TIGR03299 family)